MKIDPHLTPQPVTQVAHGMEHLLRVVCHTSFVGGSPGSTPPHHHDHDHDHPATRSEKVSRKALDKAANIVSIPGDLCKLVGAAGAAFGGLLMTAALLQGNVNGLIGAGVASRLLPHLQAHLSPPLAPWPPSRSAPQSCWSSRPDKPSVFWADSRLCTPHHHHHP